jgi:GTPase SAR1 family protein
MTTVHPCKIVVMGDGSIGKTCMLHSYTHDLQYLAESQQYVRTVFENYQAEIPIKLDGAAPSSIRLSLWDTAGQEEYDQLRQMCYSSKAMKPAAGGAAPIPGSHQQQLSPASSFSGKGAAQGSFDVSVFIVCFAWNNPQSFTNVELKWYRELKKLASELGGGSASARRPFSVVLVATKSDLRQEADEKSGGGFVKGFISRSQASDLQKSIRADAFVECSAKTGEGIREVFQQAMLVWYQQSGLGQQAESKGGKSCTML